ncbi:MlaD family protein [Gordonia sp. MP11Mi]
MTLTIEFRDALNLAPGAKVILDGARVGQVEAVALRPNSVGVRLGVGDAVRLPTQTHARITTATILGDPFVELSRPATTTSSYLADGDLIPTSRTYSAPPVEETLATVALFLGQGSVEKLTAMTHRLANSLPADRTEADRLAKRLSRDLRGLARSRSILDRVLASSDATARAVSSRRPDIEAAFTPRMMVGWRNLQTLIGNIGILLPSVGSIYSGGHWLVPTFRALGLATTSLTDKGVQLSDLGSAVDVVRRKLLPLLAAPSVTVNSLVSDRGKDLAPGVTAILRMLGAIQ